MSNTTQAIETALEQVVATADEIIAKIVEMHVDIEITPAGRYYKKTSRVGVAFTEVHEDGTLSYTNRRGEQSTLTLKDFDKFWSLGYYALNARDLVVAAAE